LTEYVTATPPASADRLRNVQLGLAGLAFLLAVCSAYVVTRPHAQATPLAPAVPLHADVEARPLPRPHRRPKVVHRHYARKPSVDLAQAASLGLAHPLFTRSPGGAYGTAARVAQWRGLIEHEARGSGFSPAVLEGVIFLESAGRSDAIAGSDPAAASGLTQIVASTGAGFLHMRVELAKSRRLTWAIDRAYAHGRVHRAHLLEAKRRRVDQRFDPADAIAGTVRYLESARRWLGRDDLAVASYHMGIGNLQGVIARWSGSHASTAAVVRSRGLSWSKLYFGMSPDRHAAAWRRLDSLDDDTQNYLWKVLAAERIMWLYRHDPRELAAQDWLQARKSSGEEVLHPSSRTPQFATPNAIARAWKRGALERIPRDWHRTHVKAGRYLGQMASRLGRRRALYAGLRPVALEALLTIGRRTFEISHDRTPLLVGSAVRDERYQRVLARHNTNATHSYSMHTTGFAFDLIRSYGSKRQAAALQFELDRLQALDVIQYIKEPGNIHVAVASDAGRKLRLLRAAL
jgi:hypothetical protein